MTTGWLIGYAIGAVVVVLVVVLLLILIWEARKIGDQAVEITRALEETRDNTDGLWEVAEINGRLNSITERLGIARRVLGGKS